LGSPKEKPMIPKLIAVVATSALAVFVGSTAWLVWFRPPRFADRLARHERLPEASRKRMRSIVPLAASMVFLVVLVVARAVSSGGLEAAAAVAMAVCLVLHLVVFHFDRPAFLIPPALRGDAGAAAQSEQRRTAQ
jgi:hypothetical protein